MKLSRAVALLAHPTVLAGASVLATLVARGRRGAVGTRLAVALPAAVLSSKWIKRRFPRRKPRLLSLPPRESFPSGHAAGTTAVALALVDAFRTWKLAPVAGALIALVDACRLHDREHRPNEVLVGNALGIAGAGLASLVARRLAHV